ncbi:MAG: DUF1104 domain-containing protein [Epsilonproteobacteria bacterium]|nr:DUF1104 domain-containing protein [Campylobacterota bacterium]
MKRLGLIAILLAGILNATDFSSMSTEELLELRGTVSAEERDAFRSELQSRLSTLSIEEKEALGITPKGYGDMTGTAPHDGTGLGNTYNHSATGTATQPMMNQAPMRNHGAGRH